MKEMLTTKQVFVLICLSIVLGYVLCLNLNICDYSLNLKDNHIYIEDKWGNDHVVHPDSLEEFIIQDNL